MMLLWFFNVKKYAEKIQTGCFPPALFNIYWIFQQHLNVFAVIFMRLSDVFPLSLTILRDLCTFTNYDSGIKLDHFMTCLGLET